MKIALVLIAGTLITYGITRTVAARYGGDVQRRFVERGAVYSTDSLAAWITTHATEAAGYAFPVLFPADLLFMAFLAGMLGFISVRAATSVPILRGAAPWFAILPSLYLAVDLAEDAVLATFLTFPFAINDANVVALRAFTQVKIWSVTAALIQTLLVVLLLAVRMLR